VICAIFMGGPVTHSITRGRDWKRLKLLQDEPQVAVAAFHRVAQAAAHRDSIRSKPLERNGWNHWNEWNFVYGTGPLP
jgi:hypothetical protein